MNADSVKSPGELTVFVDKLLAGLEGKFDAMSDEILQKMSDMSNRIDALETAISELVHSDLNEPAAANAGLGLGPVAKESEDKTESTIKADAAA